MLIHGLFVRLMQVVAVPRLETELSATGLVAGKSGEATVSCWSIDQHGCATVRASNHPLEL